MRKSTLASIAELSEFIASGDLRYAVQQIHPIHPGHLHQPWYEWLLRPAFDDDPGVSEHDFLSAVESLELSAKLDRRLVGDACAWLIRRRAPARLSLRVSGATFADRGFARAVVRGLEGSARSAAQLCFALSIDDVTRDPGNATRFVRSVRERGSLIALDCDVAGDPMLALLAPLGLVDFLQIRRKWTATAPASEAHRITLESICDYGRRLGLELIAKGVDDAVQLALLSRLGVEFYQGGAGGDPRGVDLEDEAERPRLRYGRSA